MGKRLIAALAALLLVFTAVSALGEGTYVDLKARDVVVSKYTDTLGCRFEDSNYYCLIRPDGTPITGELYRSVNSVSSYPFFKVEADSADGLHDEGIIDDQGNVIVPAVYADVTVVSDRWAYGVKLKPSSADDKDYTVSNWSTGEKDFYRIDTVDFYYRGTLAGTLDRSEFSGYPTAYGDYIYVQTRESVRKYYNSRMEVSAGTVGNSGEYSTEYKNRMTHYTHNGSGQEAFAAGCTLTPEEVEKFIVYENGAFRNLQGEEPFKAAQNYDSLYSFTGSYGIVRMNSKSGVIDLNGTEVIPLEYDRINNTGDILNLYGVTDAEKDGKFGYVDTAGNVTSAFTYSTDVVRSYGPLATINNLDGTVIVLSAAAGELPEHYQDVDMSYYSRAFVAVNGNKEHSLIDMTGEVLIPYTDVSYINFNLDATVAVYSLGSRTYRIYTFTHDNESPVTGAPSGTDETEEKPEAEADGQPAADGTWTCSNGHAGNTGKFCPECGEARPEDEIVCPECGTHYPADEAPNFCPNDGTKLK